MTLDRSWYSGRRALVTGGAGFIGSHIAEALVRAGCQVTVADSFVPAYGGNEFNLTGFRDQIELSITDMRDQYGMAHLVAGKDVIFNLAGQVSHIDSMTDPVTDLEINCKAQLGLMEALRYRNTDARVVFASTRQVYGKPQYLPVDEAHPVEPTDVNGINKHSGEQYHLLYSRIYGIPTAVLRLTNTYGPRQLMHHGRQGFIPVFVRRAIEGETIQLYGGGGQRRDANYISDVVDAFLLAGSLLPEISGGIFNLGNKPSFSLLELATVLRDIVGRGEVVSVPWPGDRAPIDIGDFETNFDKATAQLGWHPSVGLRAGLQRTVEFYTQHREYYW
ncbi:MAG: NAD-dependent epimerase/dehydratase family protein [Actinomycetota bacterium]|nr:NAD-dependent epimerase/dehydratase family protein [Actinomycetota bacterium]